MRFGEHTNNDLVILGVVGEGESKYRISLRCGARRHEVTVRAVEYTPGIRAIQDSEMETLYDVLAETGHLGCVGHLASLIWEMEEGVTRSFPLLLDNERGVCSIPDPGEHDP